MTYDITKHPRFDEWLDNQEHEEEPSEPDHEKHYKLKIEEGR